MGMFFVLIFAMFWLLWGFWVWRLQLGRCCAVGFVCWGCVAGFQLLLCCYIGGYVVGFFLDFLLLVCLSQLFLVDGCCGAVGGFGLWLLGLGLG